MVQQKFRYSDPAFYRVIVANEIPRDEVEILSNYYFGEVRCDSDDEHTQLSGLIKDQAALCGLLSYLTDLHCTVISINKSEENS